MADIIEMPKLSDTMTVGTLVKWLKKEGDKVASGDMLAEVETDKATMELESFFDGTLLKIFVEGGAQVAIGEALCAIGEKGEKVEAPAKSAAPAKEEKKSEPKADAKAEKKPAEKSAGPAPAAKAESTPAPASDQPEPAEDEEADDGESVTSGRVKVSPLARKLAAAKGVDLAKIKGSGPRGRIVRADVLAAAKNPPAAKPAATTDRKSVV